MELWGLNALGMPDYGTPVLLGPENVTAAPPETLALLKGKRLGEYDPELLGLASIGLRIVGSLLGVRGTF